MTETKQPYNKMEKKLVTLDNGSNDGLGTFYGRGLAQGEEIKYIVREGLLRLKGRNDDEACVISKVSAACKWPGIPLAQESGRQQNS